MNWRWFLKPRCGLFFLLASILSACAGTPPTAPALDLTALAAKGDTLPYTYLPSGQYTVEVMVNGQGPYTFLIDTGASISAIYPALQTELMLEELQSTRPLVRGLIESAERPAVQLDSLAWGATQHSDLTVVVLPGLDQSAKVRGVIGMDVLEHYAVMIDATNQQLTLIPADQFQTTRYRGWDSIILSQTPFGGRDYGLHFGQMNIGSRPIPALIDTGSSVSVINWEAASYRSSLRRLRSRLREEWVINGAIGAFRPRASVVLYGPTMGQHRWPEAQFVIFDLTPLDVLGSKDRPLIIAGVNMFKGRDVIFDFAGNRIYLRAAQGENARRRPETALDKATRVIGTGDDLPNDEIDTIRNGGDE